MSLVQCHQLQAVPLHHRQGMLLENQGLLGIAFFEATAAIILLALFFLFRRDHQAGYFRFWLAGWCCFTLSSLSEVTLLIRQLPSLNLAVVLAQAAALVLALLACGAGLPARLVVVWLEWSVLVAAT